jgi:hypothetical protein
MGDVSVDVRVVMHGECCSCCCKSVMDSNVQINNHRRNRISRQHSPLSTEIPAGKEAVPTKHERHISLASNKPNNKNPCLPPEKVLERTCKP